MCRKEWRVNRIVIVTSNYVWFFFKENIFSVFSFMLMYWRRLFNKRSGGFQMKNKKLFNKRSGGFQMKKKTKSSEVFA
jgi:hypothetical protein